MSLPQRRRGLLEERRIKGGHGGAPRRQVVAVEIASASTHAARPRRMDIVELLDRTLSRPPSAIAWSIHRELAKLRPGKALLTTDSCSFDVDDYERGGLCRRQPMVPAPLLETDRDEEYRATYRVATGWHAVDWRGVTLEVVTLSFFGDGCTQRLQWVIADSEKLAQAFFEEVCRWNDTPRARLLVFQHGEFRKSAELYEQIRRTTFDALVLPGQLKEEIRADVTRFFGAKTTYAEYGVPWKRGLLLIGPPGNGKTHTLRGLVHECGRPCLYVKDFKGRHSTETHNIGRVASTESSIFPCRRLRTAARTSRCGTRASSRRCARRTRCSTGLRSAVAT